MKEKRKVAHSLTAYSCRICTKYHSNNLLAGTEEIETAVDLSSLLDEYFAYIRKSKIDGYTSRTILLEKGKFEHCESIMADHVFHTINLSNLVQDSYRNSFSVPSRSTEIYRGKTC